jgi:hypothetical protein
VKSFSFLRKSDRLLGTDCEGTLEKTPDTQWSIITHGTHNDKKQRKKAAAFFSTIPLICPIIAKSVTQTKSPVVKNELFILKNELFILKNDSSSITGDLAVITDALAVIKNKSFLLKNEVFLLKNEAFLVKNEASVTKDEASVIKNEASHTKLMIRMTTKNRQKNPRIARIFADKTRLLNGDSR